MQTTDFGHRSSPRPAFEQFKFRSTNNACRIVLARNNPIDCEQAAFDHSEGSQSAEPTEEDDGEGREQERAEDVGENLAVALRSGLAGSRVRHLASPLKA